MLGLGVGLAWAHGLGWAQAHKIVGSFHLNYNRSLTVSYVSCHHRQSQLAVRQALAGEKVDAKGQL